MLSRAIVRRWHRTTRSATNDAMSAAGLVVVLDVVQRGAADLQPFLVLGVPLRDSGVEVPAVIVEASGLRQRLHRRKVEPFQLAEADDDVGDLDAGVVDVVLNLDRRAPEREHAHERVAERRVAEVADVRGLVGVDCRVLDDRLDRGAIARARRIADAEPGQQERRAVEEDVEIAVRRGFDAADAVAGSEPSGDLLRDDLRRLAQPAGQLERDGHAEVAECPIRRLFDREVQRRIVKRIQLRQNGADAGTDRVVQRKNHDEQRRMAFSRAPASGEGARSGRRPSTRIATVAVSDMSICRGRRRGRRAARRFVGVRRFGLVLRYQNFAFCSMVDAGIGRLLIASLHQGIADIAPTRLPFYENWLTAPGLAGRKFGLAPLHAVLSFLRLEGEPSYSQIMHRAGCYTGDWAFAELSRIQRNLVRRCPAAIRPRVALWLSSTDDPADVPRIDRARAVEGRRGHDSAPRVDLLRSARDRRPAAVRVSIRRRSRGFSSVATSRPRSTWGSAGPRAAIGACWRSRSAAPVSRSRAVEAV